jgi:hypothetical protein
LEELLAECEHIVVVDREDHGRTNILYHGMDAGTACLIRQPQRKLPLAKQEEENEKLDNMQQLVVIEESYSSSSSCLFWSEKEWGNLLLRRLKEIKELYKEIPVSTGQNSRHLRQAGWNQMVLHFRSELQVLAST